MGFLLKIVEGPNKGAEIALVEGVSVTLGKSDDCDVILADPTLPDSPATVAAASDGVTFDGEALALFHVVTRGATSFAAGPSDRPWDELVWPEQESKGQETAGEGREEDGGSSPAPSPAPAEPAPADEEAPAGKKSRRGCLGCLVALVILLVVLALLAFFLRDRPQCEKAWVWTTNTVSGVCERHAVSGNDGAVAHTALTLADVIANRSLSTTNRNSRMVLVGDFATRAERLVATAEAYAAKPGVDLDFCDDETLKTAAEDTLAMLSEPDLRVVAATNRVVALAGKAWHIRRALEALSSDLPKLRDVDVSGVTLANGVIGAPAGVDVREATDDRRDAPASNVPQIAPKAAQVAPKAAPAKPALPVCGILTTPYPCLVLRSGARVLEGASVGDSVVVKIEADAVTVTNAMGRFVWKP